MLINNRAGLMVSDLEGRFVVELLKLETTPHRLVLDPLRGQVYWIGSDGDNSDIHTADRQGSGPFRNIISSYIHI